MGLDFDAIEAELDIDLPEAYRDFIAAFDESGCASKPLGYLVIHETQEFITLNERVDDQALAGLDKWPAQYVLFGEDGCGNFYAFDAASEQARVLFYDHESDELIVETHSLIEFAQQLAAEEGERAAEPSDAKREVISSGYTKRKEQAITHPREAEALPDDAFREDWQTDWSCFVRDAIQEFSRGLDAGQLTTALNARFGSRPVWWVGVVEEIDLGKYKSVALAMPECAQFPAWGNYDWGAVRPALRTEEEDWHDTRDPSSQILTSLSAWRAVSPGDTIRFQMMIAPGHEDKISCIAFNDFGIGDRFYISVKNTGGHVTEILSTG